MCMWVVTSECGSSDSDRARAAMRSAGQSSRTSPQPSGRRRTGLVWTLTMTGQEYWK